MEGSLEAPTRHPLDWRNPAFHDEEALHKELTEPTSQRIFALSAAGLNLSSLTVFAGALGIEGALDGGGVCPWGA